MIFFEIGELCGMAEALGMALPGDTFAPATIRNILNFARTAGIAAMTLAAGIIQEHMT